jgi:CheY-like chemotaxis protein
VNKAQILDSAQMSTEVASRILVVDDDEGLLEVIATILEPLGLNVTTVTRASEALMRLAKEKFDLVVSDLVMPGVDGHDLIEVLRSRNDMTPVLYLSGSGKVPDVVKLMKQGASGFLEKPFEPADLKREVLGILKEAREKRRAPAGVLAADVEPYDDTSLVVPSIPAPSQSPWPERLGRYEIRGLIAAGGMGKVFRALDPHLDREVALKVLRAPQSESEKEQFLPRFRREAVALAKLRHPHIVSVHDFGVDESGVPFVVMELVDGPSLSTIVQQAGHLPVARALHFAQQVAEALAYAHERGIVHRDVKPDNVVVEKNDWVRLIDFGIARVDDSNLTVASHLLGSPSYLSPEAACSRPVDWRADQFSLATVILEMVSGYRVFRGENIGATVKNVCDMRAPTLAELGVKSPPPGLQDLLDRMHQKEPAQRVQDEAELLAELSRLLSVSL